jgi:phosphotransferase system enzyme I (PtsI)
MGLRAIRWSLSEPEMFRAQLRAILRASAHGPVEILVPMLAHLREITATLAEIESAKGDLRAAGKVFGEVRVGAMIEVPAAALITRTFLRHFDFVSIGTNDLIQYTLAIDRADESVAHLYDPWHPAVLHMIHDTIRSARQAGKGVCVCGEMAGDPEFTGLLIAMGLRRFSMHPSQVLTVKQEVLRSHAGRLSNMIDTVLASDDPRSAWAQASRP